MLGPIFIIEINDTECVRNVNSYSCKLLFMSLYSTKIKIPFPFLAEKIQFVLNIPINVHSFTSIVLLINVKIDFAVLKHMT